MHILPRSNTIHKFLNSTASCASIIPTSKVCIGAMLTFSSFWTLVPLYVNCKHHQPTLQQTGQKCFSASTCSFTGCFSGDLSNSVHLPASRTMSSRIGSRASCKPYLCTINFIKFRCLPSKQRKLHSYEIWHTCSWRFSVSTELCGVTSQKRQ